MTPRIEGLEIEIGNISSCLKIEDYILKYFERPPEDDEDEDTSGYNVQCRIANTTSYSLDNFVVDVSFYDKEGKFLGLTKTGLLDIQELDPKGTVPFDLWLDVPEDTNRCILNASARVISGWWYRFILGAKK